MELNKLVEDEEGNKNKKNLDLKVIDVKDLESEDKKF